MSELSTVAKRFFNFIEAYASVKNKMQTDYQQAGETQELEELRKEHLPGVSIGDAGSEVVLRVERPILYKCPPPPLKFLIGSDWIGQIIKL